MPTAQRKSARPAAELHELPVRERVLAAALGVLQAEGIHALTQTRVAEVAGVRQGHLTYYFKTRADLLKGIVELCANDAESVLAGDPARFPPSVDALKRHLCARVTDARMARVMLALAAASDEDPSLKRWIVDFDRRVLASIGAVFRALGHEPEEREIALFHATMVGMAVLTSSEATPAAAARARELVGAAVDRIVAAAKRPAGARGVAKGVRLPRTAHPHEG